MTNLRRALLLFLLALCATPASAPAASAQTDAIRADARGVSLAGAAIPLAPERAPRAPAIVGGAPAVPGAYPWATFIEMYAADGSYITSCTASLVGARWVMTAAHCVMDDHGQFNAAGGVFAWVGYYSQGEMNSTNFIKSDYTWYWPYNESVSKENDLALIRLAQPVPYQAIRIAGPGADDARWAPGTGAVGIGWGDTAEGSGQGSDILREAAFPIVENAACARLLETFVPATMLCAGAPGADTCQGDSGGPLMVRDGYGGWLQAGVTSYGKGCGRNPGAYTRIAAFIPWILDLVKTDPVAPIAPPTVSPGVVKAISSSSAEISFSVDPNNLAATVIAEYGKTAALGTFVTAYGGAGDENPIVLTLSNLAPGVAYHYRLVVITGAGVVHGPVRRFSIGGTADDAVPPKVKALNSAGAAGSRVRLSYTVHDAVSPRTRERLTITALGGRQVGRVNTRWTVSKPGVRYWATWRAPAGLAGVYRFCVEAFDENGNKSRPSCARLRLT